LLLNIPRRTQTLGKIVERIWTNFKLIWYVVRIKPDIVHSDNLDTLPAGYLASRLCGSRLVYDAYEIWYEMVENIGDIGRNVAIGVEKYLSRKSDAVFTVSKNRAELMAEVLGIPLPIVLMNTPDYIPFEQLSPGDWVKPFAGKKIVLYQGGYRENMGLREAILSAKFLPDDVVMVFRGLGICEHEMRKTIQENDLGGRVFMIPPVSMNALVSSAVGADLGLIVYKPVNKNNYYAAPNKMFEYIMAGVPCVGSDLPYIRDVLHSFGVGEVFVPADSEDMAKVIVEFLNDNNRLSLARKNCIENARRLCWEYEGKKLLTEYERISPTNNRGN
jgi:glycosyltransferase involved in cell wall biosynthesis